MTTLTMKEEKRLDIIQRGSGLWQPQQISKRKTEEEAVKQIVELARGKYQGCVQRSPCNRETPKQKEIKLSREMVSRILRVDASFT